MCHSKTVVWLEICLQCTRLAAEVLKLELGMQVEEARTQLISCFSLSWWCGLPELHLLGSAWYARWMAYNRKP